MTMFEFMMADIKIDEEMLLRAPEKRKYETLRRGEIR